MPGYWFEELSKTFNSNALNLTYNDENLRPIQLIDPFDQI